MITSLTNLLYSGAGTVAAAGLLAGACAYAALYPTSQIFGRTLIAQARHRELALTFDDGPNPEWTPQLIDILARYKVRATFFLVGRFAEQEPLLTRYVADAGHLVGNHSWSHPNLALLAPGGVRDELSRTSEILQRITGRPIRYFRPPFGARRPDVLWSARRMGMTPVLWNAMTTDWSETSSDRIAGRLVEKIDGLCHGGRGANIVLHDGNHRQLGADRGPSVGAAERLLSRYAKTHRFVTVDAWG